MFNFPDDVVAADTTKALEAFITGKEPNTMDTLMVGALATAKGKITDDPARADKCAMMASCIALAGAVGNWFQYDGSVKDIIFPLSAANEWAEKEMVHSTIFPSDFAVLEFTEPWATSRITAIYARVEDNRIDCHLFACDTKTRTGSMMPYVVMADLAERKLSSVVSIDYTPHLTLDKATELLNADFDPTSLIWHLLASGLVYLNQSIDGNGELTDSRLKRVPALVSFTTGLIAAMGHKPGSSPVPAAPAAE